MCSSKLTKEQINYVYAEEADVLNMALFGMTAKEWRNKNKNLDGNIRDHATINELICLANLENLNSVFINDGLTYNLSYVVPYLNTPFEDITIDLSCLMVLLLSMLKSSTNFVPKRLYISKDTSVDNIL